MIPIRLRFLQRDKALHEVRTIDSTDRAIVECLRSNPRATNREVAEELGVAELTVANRLLRMAEKSQMRVVAQKHLFADGYTTICMYFVTTSASTVQRISRAIAEIVNVFSVSQGMGNPDIVVMARTASNAEVHGLAKQIGAVRGVSMVESVIIYAIHKLRNGVGDLVIEMECAEEESEDLDDRIFAAFRKDGRQSNREVGRQMGVSETSIRHRLNRMLTSGLMQFEVICHPDFVGMAVIAVGRVQTQPGSAGDIIGKLVDSDLVGWLAETSGEYNIHLILTASSNAELGDFCDNMILPLKGLRKLDIQIQVARSKHEYHLAYFDARESIPKRK